MKSFWYQLNRVFPKRASFLLICFVSLVVQAFQPAELVLTAFPDFESSPLDNFVIEKQILRDGTIR